MGQTLQTSSKMLQKKVTKCGKAHKVKKSVRAKAAANPKEGTMTETQIKTFQDYEERLVRVKERFDYENPRFRKAAGLLADELHHSILHHTDTTYTPFIDEWFTGYLKTKKFAELKEDEKERTFWVFQELSEFWRMLGECAYILKAGYHAPDYDEVLKPDFEPTNKRSTYPIFD